MKFPVVNAFHSGLVLSWHCYVQKILMSLLNCQRGHLVPSVSGIPRLRAEEQERGWSISRVIKVHPKLALFSPRLATSKQNIFIFILFLNKCFTCNSLGMLYMWVCHTVRVSPPLANSVKHTSYLGSLGPVAHWLHTSSIAHKQLIVRLRLRLW